LQQAILDSMNPGDRLPSERGLSENLGVSRIVTREALKQLAERGLIDGQAGVGMFVRKVEPGLALKPLQLCID
jgi:GntR family transcriptional repressor for pyruvate dehydrogenase complex